jgi:hypothetical protein
VIKLRKCFFFGSGAKGRGRLAGLFCDGRLAGALGCACQQIGDEGLLPETRTRACEQKDSCNQSIQLIIINGLKALILQVFQSGESKASRISSRLCRPPSRPIVSLSCPTGDKVLCVLAWWPRLACWTALRPN